MQIQNALCIIYHSGFGFRPRKGRPLMKKPKSALVIALVLTALFAFTSCEAKNSEDTLVNVYFGDITARGINDTAYDVSTTEDITSSTVLNKTADNLYWAYSAEKTDALLKTGETKDENENVIFKNISDGKGLSETLSFSRGTWKFTLKAYTTTDARTAGTAPVYSGNITTNVAKNTNAVAVPLNYAYSAGGAGNAEFEYTVTLTQDNTGVATYTIGKVEVTATPKATDGTLKTAKTAELSAETNSNVYKGTVENLDYGLVTVKIDVYVDGTVYSTTSEDYMIMTGLNTKFAGTAAVTITEGKVGIKFDSSSIPTAQPEQSNIS